MILNFSLYFLLFLMPLPMSTTMTTISAAKNSNMPVPKSMKELQSERSALQQNEKDLEHKISFRHNGALVATGLAAIFGLVAVAFQVSDSRLTVDLNRTKRNITTITERIHELDTEAEALARKALEKRTLSPQQFNTISETLRSLPQRTAQVSCPAGNEEAYSFAKQISRALESAHWRTGAGTVQMPNAPQDTGITLFVRQAESDGANQLRDALSKAGIRATVNAREPLPGIIKVYVGPKP